MTVQMRLAFSCFVFSQASAASTTISGSDIIVVMQGSQAGNDARQATKGIDNGIMKSANKYLRKQIMSIEFLHLELGPGDLFGDVSGTAHVLPWLTRHIEKLPAKVIVSMGSEAATIVDTIVRTNNMTKAPQWHIKCAQEACGSENQGSIGKESCMRFWPEGKEILKNIGLLYPSIRELVVIVDGSEISTHIFTGLSSATAVERRALCGGCNISALEVNSVSHLQAIVVAEATFFLLPSIEKIQGATAGDIGQALQSKGPRAMVPLEVLPYGGFSAIRPHQGIGAEECSLRVAQAVSLDDVSVYDTWDSNAFKTVVHEARLDSLPDIIWYEGMLHHNGHPQWDPVEFRWQKVALNAAPKILVYHSYGRSYEFTASEHSSFIDGLSMAGHELHCTTFGLFCDGNLEIRVLYWLTKNYFTDADSIALMATYTKEYVKRYKPIAVYVTDDNALQFGVIPCFEPLQRGPSPQYHECSQTQYLAGGINNDVRRKYRSKCIEYNVSGTCARGNFFTEEGLAVEAACGACVVGIEPQCVGCRDLYKKTRPVNITVHYEAGDARLVHMIARSIKPNMSKMVYIVDDTSTSVGWKDAIVNQYARMVRDGATYGISADFDNDWHVVKTPTEFLSIVESYQDKPEYILWLPSILGMLPTDAGEQAALWRQFINVNRLGEVNQVGTTNEALVQAASSPEGMGRVCAVYTDFIVRDAATAAALPVVMAPLTTTFANVDRAKQLSDNGIVAIPPSVLSLASGVYNLCQPGTFLQDGMCTSCPAGTFKTDYGDSQESCLLCLSLNGIQMISVAGSRSSSECMCKPTQYYDTSCGDRNALATTSVCCFQCLEGSYQDQPGQSSCPKCTGGKTTRFLGSMTASDCLCRPGTLKSEDNVSCSTCTEGYQCSEWDQVKTLAAPGYFVNPTPIHGATGQQPVFQCFGNKLRCPGGIPGSCSSGRMDLACSLCEPDTEAMNDGTCRPCGGQDVAPFALAVGGSLIVLTGLYCSTLKDNRIKQTLDMAFLAVAFGLLITAFQLMGILSVLQLTWGEPVGAILRSMKLVNFDIQMLSLGCIAPPTPSTVFFMKCFIIVCAMVFLALIHVVYVSFRHKGSLRQHHREIVHSIGIFYLVVFISHTSMVLGALQCQRHPSGLATLQQYQTVICWTTVQHHNLVIMCLVFLTFPLFFVSLCIWVVYQFPKRLRIGDEFFVRMWSFLVHRFHASTNWYLIVSLCRSFIVSLVPIFPSALIQISSLQFAFVITLMLLTRFMPWRSRLANVADGFLMLSILLVLNTAPFFVRDANVDDVGLIGSFIIGSLLVALLLAVVWKIGKWVFTLGYKHFKFFLCHHKAGAGAFSRFLYMGLCDKVPHLRVFIDWENLTDLDTLFDSVRQTETLVVLCTKLIATRPWCMGELTTAHNFGTKTVLVRFPGFELPSTSFIDGYNEVFKDCADLLSRGITLPLIQRTLHWWCGLPAVVLPKDFSPQLVYALRTMLLAGAIGSIPVERSPQTERQQQQSATIVDHKDWEASASAHILARLLREQIQEFNRFPVVLARGETLEHQVVNLLVVCTNNSWHSPSFVQSLISAYGLSQLRLPIIVEEVFRIPDETFFSNLKESYPNVSHSDGTMFDVGIMIEVVQGLFKEIGVSFCPQSPGATRALLDVRAKQVVGRISQTTRSRFPESEKAMSATTTLSSRLSTLNEPHNGTWSQDSIPKRHLLSL